MSDPLPDEDGGAQVPSAPNENSALSTIVGSSADMRKVRDLIARIAPIEASVLITGEAGTGKSLVAHAIHELSRRKGPFVEIPLGTVSSELAPATLFGNVKGAFTGAVERVGLLETAQKGTVYLSDLEQAPTQVQALLVAFLDEGTFRRLGDPGLRKADVRVICSTQDDSTSSVISELRNRVAGFVVQLPPLRNHPEDLPILIESILSTLGPKSISPEAISKLRAYPFPGNIRELKSVLRRASVLAKTKEITPEDLGLEERPQASESGHGDALQAELRDARAQLDVYQRAAIIAAPIWQGRNFTAESDYCFVLMPFSDVKDLPSVYQNHVKPVLEKCGLRCERADDIHDISGIMQSVWESINRARLIVAEMTERNSNVFYELGIAHTLGKQVIMITQSMDYVPFDLKHLRCIVYEYKPARIDRFEAALEKTVKTVLSGTQTPTMSLIKAR